MFNPIISVGISLASIGISGAGTIYSIVSGKRYNKLCDRLNQSIDDLYDKDIKIDISEQIVNEIIDKTVKEQLNASVPRVEQMVANAFAEQLKEQVKKEINAQYADIKAEVKKEIKDRIGHIDINEARKEVVAEAKDEAARLFREEYRYRMDQLVDNAGEEIKDVVKRAKTDISHALDIHKALTDFSKK